MSARDDYPGLLALAEMLPDRAGGQQAAQALAEIDRLCDVVEKVSELCDSPYGNGYIIAKIREAIDGTPSTCSCRIGNNGRGTYRQANPDCPVHQRPTSRVAEDWIQP